MEDREIRRPVETVHEMALKSRAFSRLVLTLRRWQKTFFNAMPNDVKVGPLTCVFLSLTASLRPDLA